MIAGANILAVGKTNERCDGRHGVLRRRRRKRRRCFYTAEIQSAKRFLKSIKDIRMVEIAIKRPCGSSRLKCLGYDEIGRWISSPAGPIGAHERVHWSRTGVRSITRRILSRGLPVSMVLVPRAFKRCTLEGRPCFEGAASRQPRLLHRYLPLFSSPLQFYCLLLPFFDVGPPSPGAIDTLDINNERDRFADLADFRKNCEKCARKTSFS